MTQPTIRLKVRRTSVVRGKALVRFPANVQASSPILLDKTGGAFTFSLDMDALEETLAAIFQPVGVDQEITSGASVAINANSATVRINKTVGGAITLALPPAILKTVPVLVADWKGDAGTNNITLSPNGSEKIQGLSSWTIGADNGSIFLRPIPGVGYVI